MVYNKIATKIQIHREVDFMQKLTRIIAASLTLIMIISCFTACKSMIIGALQNKTDEEKAEMLLKRSDSYYSGGVHEESTAKLTLSGRVHDADISETSTVTTSSTVKLSSFSFAYLNKQDVYVKSTSDKTHQVNEYTKIEGFVDGNSLIQAYIPTGKSADKEPTYIKSKCSKKDAYDFYFYKTAAGSEDAPDYNELFKSVEVVIDENEENWIITYKDFDSSQSAKMSQWLGELATSFPVPLVIREATAVFTVDILDSAIVHYEISMKVDIYDKHTYDYDLTAKISISADLSKPSSDSLTPENIDDYKEVKDIRYNTYVKNAIAELLNSDGKYFNYSAETKVTATSNKISDEQTLTSYSLIGSANYGYINDKFRFNVSLNGNGVSDVSASFCEDKLTVNGDKRSCTSSEARSYFKSLFSDFLFSEEYVTDQTILDNEDGSQTVVLRFRITPDLENAFVSMGLGKANIENHEITVEVGLDKNMDLTRAEITMRGEKVKYVSYQKINCKFFYRASIRTIKETDQKALSELTP